MNIGFKEAGRLYDNQCYIFHDVDLLPEDDRNLYSCPSQPRHMSAGVDTMSYKYVYRQHLLHLIWNISLAPVQEYPIKSDPRHWRLFTPKLNGIFL